MRPLFCIPLLALVLNTLPAQAQAQAQTSEASKSESAAIAEARQRFNEGVKHFDGGKYDLAVAAFKQAYALKAAPEILRNLGAAELKAGNKRDGARHLAEYLRSAADLPEDERADITKELTKAERSLSRIHVHVNPADAEITIDDEPVGAWVASDPWHVDPGEHIVRAKHAGYEDAEQAVTTGAGDAELIELELSAARREAPEAPSPEETSASAEPFTPEEFHDEAPRTVPLILGGTITALALVGGIGFRLSGSSKEDEANGQRDRRNRSGGSGACTATRDAALCTNLRDLYESADRSYNVSTISFAVSGAAAVATAIYYVWPRSRRRQGMLPATVIQPRSAQFLLSGSF
ncbi:MAG TPA: PEGA domain-containing protein [Polyangiaceae bacterium]|nr:PEGA domain-containing protein [Polyangiaceae bacterium]